MSRVSWCIISVLMLVAYLIFFMMGYIIWYMAIPAIFDSLPPAEAWRISIVLVVIWSLPSVASMVILVRSLRKARHEQE